MDQTAPAWQAIVSTLVSALQTYDSDAQKQSGGCGDTEIAALHRQLERTRSMTPIDALKFMGEAVEDALHRPLDASWGNVVPSPASQAPTTDSLFDVVVSKSEDLAVGVLGSGFYDLARTFFSGVPHRGSAALSEAQLITNARYSLNVKYGLGLKPADEPVEAQFRSSDWTIGFLAGNRIYVATGTSYYGDGAVDHGYRTVHLVPNSLPAPTV